MEGKVSVSIYKEINEGGLERRGGRGRKFEVKRYNEAESEKKRRYKIAKRKKVYKAVKKRRKKK